MAAIRDAAAEIDDLGYGGLWLPESPGGRDVMTYAGLVLAATPRIPVATGIAIIWGRDPTTAGSGARTLAEAFPGRFVLGIGVSHRMFVTPRGHDYRPTVAGLGEYVDAMRTAKWIGPEPAEGPVLLGALGPRMLDLARDRLDGAHPYKVTPQHTRDARRLLGPDRILAPEQAVVVSDDADAARDAARRHLRVYLRLENYRRSFLRQGFDDADLEGDGSDRLLDAIVAHGPSEAAIARITGHLDAGADHVAIQVVPPPGGDELSDVRTLATALDLDQEEHP